MKDYSNTGHKTYYLGLAEELATSNRIRLYYSEEYPITINNLEKYFKDSFSHDESSGENYYLKENEVFLIPSVDENGNFRNIRFNTIIYFSGVSGNPIGYTSFSHIQEMEIDGENSRISNIKIRIDFKFNEGFDLEADIKILNTLSSINKVVDDRLASSLTKKLLGSESHNYATISSVRDYFEETKTLNYRKYTSFLGDLYSDDSLSLITDSTLINGGKDYSRYQFKLVSDQNINDYNTSFSRFFVGNYKNDVVLYQWDPLSWTYRVISLTKSNAFDIPSVVIPVGKVDRTNLGDFELEYMACKYAVFYNREQELWGIYDLLAGLSNPEKALSILPEGSGLSIDPWDETGKVIFFSRSKKENLLSQFSKSDEIYKELISLPIDLINISLQFIGKIGPWFKFRGYSEFGNPIIYVSLNGCIYTSEGGDTSILPISNRCILSQKIGTDSTDYEFYFVEQGKTMKTVSYLELSGEKDTDENKEYRMVFNSAWIPGSSDDTTRAALLDGLRRRPLISYDLPKNGFLSSYSGILFYGYESSSDKNYKLNYL